MCFFFVQVIGVLARPDVERNFESWELEILTLWDWPGV